MPESNLDDSVSIVRRTIRQRRTFKVLANSQTPVSPPDNQRRHDETVFQAIETAGWAPFHYDRAVQGVAEPWRVEFLGHQKCQEIADQFFDWFDDVKPNNKLPSMLRACGSAVLVSWLPQFSGPGNNAGGLSEKQQQVDEEHLAATAAFIQNLILILTAAGLGTYWSSGGQFRSELMKTKLNIQHPSRLLAVVFVDYDPNNDSRERLPGKLRDKRDADLRWFRRIS